MKTQKLGCGDKIVFLDIETTGLSYSVDDIIEVGAWLYCDGVAINKFERRIKPERYVSETVRRITGISNEDLADCDTMQNVLPEFFDFVGSNDIAGYNIQFDYKFLCYKAKVLGYDFTLGGMRRGVDVLKSVRKCFDLPSYKLGDVCVSLGVPSEPDRLHTALYDAYMTKLVYDRCKYEIPYLLDDTKYGRPVITDTLDLF